MDRIETVIKSYANDLGSNVLKGSSPRGRFDKNHPDTEWNTRDSDLKAAYEELDDFLGKKTGSDRRFDPPDPKNEAKPKGRPIPQEAVRDLAELGLTPNASLEQCKAAYKELLKIHHPDRHSRHEGNMRKATEKSARVNAAYQRLEKWFKTGQ